EVGFRCLGLAAQAGTEGPSLGQRHAGGEAGFLGCAIDGEEDLAAAVPAKEREDVCFRSTSFGGTCFRRWPPSFHCKAGQPEREHPSHRPIPLQKPLADRRGSAAVPAASGGGRPTG